MSKRIHIAGKLNFGEQQVGEFGKELEDRGHMIPLKWWELGNLPTPYMDNPSTSAAAAEDMIRSAVDSDVFILFPGAKILGAAVEFGAAIASLDVRDNKEILVVDPFATRQSVFYAHPAILAVHGLEEIRTRPWY